MRKGKLKILLAEDDKINQLLIKKVVEDAGFSLDIVKTGKQAIEQLSLNHYDLILMDVNMPEMDGYTATSYIRQHMGPKRDIPIIVVTSENGTHEQSKSLLIGANTFLSKPLIPRELIAEITTLVVKQTALF